MKGIKKYFKPPFRIMQLGNSESGKTYNMVNNLLLGDELRLIDFFKPENILICHTKYNSDETLKPLRKYLESQEEFDKEKQVFKEPGNFQRLIEEMAEQQEGLADKDYPLEDYFFILDDCAGHDILRSKTLEKLAQTGRHVKCSFIINNQSFKNVSNKVRENLSHLIINQINTRSELNKVIDDISFTNDKDGVLKMYLACLQQKPETKSHLMVCQRTPLDDRYICCNGSGRFEYTEPLSIKKK